MGLFDTFSNPNKNTVKGYKYALQNQKLTQAKTDPYFQGNMDTSNLAKNRLTDMLGLTGDYSETVESFRNAPGYQFMFDQGQRSLDQSAAARGSLNSGAHQKALMGYGQGMADQSWQQQMNNLSGLLPLGAQGAQGMMNNSQRFGDLTIGRGQAKDLNDQNGLANTLGLIGTGVSLFTGMPKMNGSTNPFASRFG